MKIAVMQASSQAEKHSVLLALTKSAAVGHEVLSFGCFEGEEAQYSYPEIALEAGLLLASRAVNFVVTGCSSGQGMMLACNQLPDVLCGYVPTAQDAFLFGRINAGNAISVPLGLNYGWAGEINLRHTLQALFEGEFGTGYPAEDVQRKQAGARQVRQMGQFSHVSMEELLEKLDPDFIRKSLSRRIVTDYILKYGDSEPLRRAVQKFS